MRFRLTLLGLFALTACFARETRPDMTRCPESRTMTCLTAPECSFDRDRECFVCACSSSAHPPMHSPDTNVPPP